MCTYVRERRRLALLRLPTHSKIVDDTSTESRERKRRIVNQAILIRSDSYLPKMKKSLSKNSNLVRGLNERASNCVKCRTRRSHHLLLRQEIGIGIEREREREREREGEREGNIRVSLFRRSKPRSIQAF